MENRILLVDDERDIVEFVEYNLIQEGFDVIKAYNGKDALTKLDQKPALILLDVMMPEMDGYELCSAIRKKDEFKNTPIIFLTAKTSEIDEIHGLEIGADDYIKKPISPKKLIARIKTRLRRKPSSANEQVINTIIKIGPLEIDREQYIVKLEGEKIVLPKKEFEILSYLASQPGKVFPRSKILNDVWGEDIFVVERTVDVHVRKIREKLGEHATIIETVKGVGYRFKNVD